MSTDQPEDRPRRWWLPWRRRRPADEKDLSSEGGRTWRQQPGYGERVLENGPDSTDEEGTHVDRVENVDHMKRRDQEG